MQVTELTQMAHFVVALRKISLGVRFSTPRSILPSEERVGVYSLTQRPSAGKRRSILLALLELHPFA
ncbi:MAG: hypothetical protein HZA25_03335 [Candidatus Niyogibacteria bacterium]|nr:hypothetical protein [Candidatus Niyogibacteria bacterium]